MRERTAQECIKRILRDIEKRRNPHPMDFADRNFVRRYNAAMDRIVESANYLCEYYPNQMDLYMELVHHSDYEISATCTSILFQLKCATKEQKLAAITSAKRLACHPDADDIAKEFGWPMNIKRWEAEMAETSRN